MVTVILLTNDGRTHGGTRRSVSLCLVLYEKIGKGLESGLISALRRSSCWNCLSPTGGYRVEAYSVASLPQGAVFDKNINNVGEVATAIQSVMHQSRSRATEVVAAVSGSSVINKIIAMPAGLTDEELETQIALEADQYIPYPLEEVALDFEVQGPTPGRDDQVDVLLAACRREAIDSRVEALELAGLTPKVVDVEAYSMERAYELIRPVAGVDPAATVAVVDIGATMTTLSVLNQGANAYTREQTFGDKQQATIKSGTEIPYQEGAASGATTTQFKEAVLKLDVTPNITPDDRILPDLVVNQDSVGELVPSANGGVVPSIDATELTTQVLVGNGETVVLGGVVKNEETIQIQKVPVLGDMPGVGSLFKSTVSTNKKVETLIFITPRILSEVLLD